MRSSNPVLRENTFQGLFAEGDRMTLDGTVAKTGLLLLLAVVTGGWTWHRFDALAAAGDVAGAFAAISPFMWGGLIAGFVLALAGTFLRQWSGITAPLYAIAEGFALGGISAFMELRYHGIVLQAVMASVGVLLVMLVVYRSGLIKVTQKFRIGVIAATGGIALLYLVQWGIMAFTHGNGMSFISGSGPLAIGFSILVVCLAALNLVLDFDLIERATSAGAPRYMEWYCAFGLMVTLVWLYLELLRLLGNSRR